MSTTQEEQIQSLVVKVAVMTSKGEATDERLEETRDRVGALEEQMGDIGAALEVTNATTGEIRDHLKQAGAFSAMWQAWLTPTRLIATIALVTVLYAVATSLMAGEEVDLRELQELQALEDVVVPVTVPGPSE